MKIQVLSLSNRAVREIELPDEVFAYPYKEHLIHEVVLSIRHASRRGTHKVKDRGEVSGSGRKLWRQKGTGRARTGDIRNPKWRKGGTVHGPQPRSYANDISAREKRNALKSALSRKLADGELTIVDSFDLASHKTKDLTAALAGLGVAGKALIVDSRDNENLRLASRNVQALKAVDALGVNVYDVVDRTRVLASEAAILRLAEVLAK